MRRPNLIAVGLVLVVVLFGATELRASQPEKLIQDYGDDMVKLFKNTDKDSELRRAVRERLVPLVNFRLMTRSALGPEARTISSQT